MSDVETASTVNSAQFQVIVAEVKAIEQQAAKNAIIVADETAQFRARLDNEIRSGEIGTDFLTDLSTQLLLLENAVATAISAANLTTRISSGDLAPAMPGV